jgi:L-alanine-DL-glutamate epimerase-like enolase superfamily enzyme
MLRPIGAERLGWTMSRIERIETIPLRVPLEHLYRGSYYGMRNRCAILTTVRTSDGVTGTAYTGDSDEEQDEILAIIRDEIAPLVAGLDVLTPERVWEAMLPVTFDQLRDRRLGLQAISCVDSAVWDAIGRAVGQPLWRLWGGYRSSIPMIGIGGYYGTSQADAEKDMKFFAEEHGMVGMKFKIGGRPPEEDIARLRHARSFVDDGFVFVVDANQGYTTDEALNFVKLLPDDIELRWFEEPTRWHLDRRGLHDVRMIGGVRVAAGQSEISRVGMCELITSGAIDVANYDASMGGGPTEWRRLAAMALMYDVELAHHEEGHLAAHLLAAVPNGTYVETFTPRRDPVYWNLITNRPPLVDGHLRLPDEPGLGWELDRDFIDRYRVDR